MTVVQESDYFYVRRFRTLQSIRCSHIWQWCNAFPAVLDLPYCQSFARFFCSMVWNPCKPAVFLPYCQSFAWFFCSVVNIHRHRPTARFICNDSCFCAIWPYFDYRYRPNGELMCNDCSYEETPVNFQTKSSPHIMNGTFTLVMSSSVVKSFKRILISLPPAVIILQLELWRRSWQKVQTCISVPFFLRKSCPRAPIVP